MFKKDKTDQERTTTTIIYALKSKKRWQDVAETIHGLIDVDFDVSEEEVEWVDERAVKDIMEETRRLMLLGIEADRKNKAEAKNGKKRKIK